MSDNKEQESAVVAVVICNEHRFLVDEDSCIWRWTEYGWRLFAEVEDGDEIETVERGAKLLFHLYGWKISEINVARTGDTGDREFRSVLKQFGDPGVEIVEEDIGQD